MFEASRFSLSFLLSLATLIQWTAAKFTYPNFIPAERRFATSLNASITKVYRPSSADVVISKFLTNYTTRSYKIEPFPVNTSDPYDSHAYKALWQGYNIAQSSLQATVQPISISTSSLMYPPTVPTVHAYNKLQNATLGPDVIWGVGSSAQQCEGAPQAEGSGPSLLDSLFHNLLVGLNNSDVSALNYYLYKDDIARLAAAGVQSYSFSIKWSRVVPFGKAGSPINEEAVAHYMDIIDTCRQYGLNPIVTLTHFDTPAKLAPVEGVLTDLLFGAFNAGYDQETFVDDYLYYAKYIVAKFGDKVGTFFTFNEPQGVSANVLGARNVQLAHAQLYRFYHSMVNGNAVHTR